MNKREKLIDEISALMTELENQDLVFLKEQAGVLDYNRKVRLKREAQPESGGSEADKGAFTVKNSATELQEVRIEQTERAKFFHICVVKVRLFMDSSEIRALFQIASAAGSPEEAGPRLFRWFKKERSDVLSEVYIPDGKSPVLKDLYQALLESFTSAS
jgi:hypothetical protein